MACDHDFYYTCVKWYFQAFFSLFQNFNFLGCPWVKRSKYGPKWQKILSVALHISGTIHHMIWYHICRIWCICVKWLYLRVLFSFFQSFDYLGCLLGCKWAKNGPKGQGNSVYHAPYLRNHTWYDCHLWYTSVKW